MALVKCEECGADISSEAVACPQCGKKIPRTSAFTKFMAVVIGGLLLIFVIGKINQVSDERRAALNEQTEEQLIAALPPEQQAEARKVRDVLKEQEAARVRLRTAK